MDSQRDGPDMYDAVPSLLEDFPRLAAFPDGSLDVYSRVHDAGGNRLSKAAFRKRLTGARSRAFRLEERLVEPGGQAVNAARQADAFGDEVRLDGCLDHHRLDLDFETHSHGRPSRIHIHEFTDGDLTYAAISEDVADWTPEAFETIPDADGYFCGNWVSVDEMSESLRTLASLLDGVALVFDPGNLTTSDPAAVRDLVDALGTLDAGIDTSLSINDRELAAFADALGVDTEEAAVRREIGISSVVVHEKEAARAAYEGGTTTVPNLVIDRTTRNTGGGDRFGAGLLHGLAVGADFDAALALGNACASYYVATGETGTKDELVEFVDSRATL
ncbi:MAG: sugar/nucleoside kinase (ribokinase family) [Natronomonas sp.]